MEIEEIVQTIIPAFNGRETEENWESREKSISRLKDIFNSGFYASVSSLPSNQQTLFQTTVMKQLVEIICQSALSLRSALVSASCAALTELVSSDGASGFIDPYADRIITCLLKLMAQSKKVVVSMGLSVAQSLIRNCSVSTRVMERLVNASTEKNTTLREKAVELVLETLKKIQNQQDVSRNQLSRNGFLDLLDKMLFKSLSDASSSARSTSRQILILYQQNWNERAALLIESLDHTTRKTLSKCLSLSSLDEKPKPVATGVKKASILASIKAKKTAPVATLSDIPVTIFESSSSNSAKTLTIPIKPSSTSPVKKSYPSSKPLKQSNTPSKPTHSPTSSVIFTANLMETPILSSPKFNDQLVFDNYEDLSDNTPKACFSKSDSIDKLESMVLYDSSSNSNETMRQTMEEKKIVEQDDFALPKLSLKHIDKQSICLTPLMKQTRNGNLFKSDNDIDLNTPISSMKISSSSPHSTNQTERQKVLRISQNLLECNLSEKYFRRICRFSKQYSHFKARKGVSEMTEDLFELWKKEFPTILSALLQILSLMDKSANDMTPVENALISIKYCLHHHPDLFIGFEQDLIWNLAGVLANTEDALYNGVASEIGCAAIDVVNEAIMFFDMELIAQLIIDLMKNCINNNLVNSISGNPSENAEKEESIKGVCFKLLAILSKKYENLTLSSEELHPVEQWLVIPVFQQKLVHDNITSDRVMTRMAVYEYLIAIWKCLGSVFVKQYLVPVGSNNSTDKGYMKGLSLPCYKLFLALAEQNKLNN